MNKHLENCPAPICQCDENPNYKKEVLWYPGEEVCNKRPIQKFQKVQLEINKLVEKGAFKNIKKSYTAHQLETTSI